MYGWELVTVASSGVWLQMMSPDGTAGIQDVFSMLTFSTTAANIVTVSTITCLHIGPVGCWPVACSLSVGAVSADRRAHRCSRQAAARSVSWGILHRLLYLKLTAQTKELETFVRWRLILWRLLEIQALTVGAAVSTAMILTLFLQLVWGGGKFLQRLPTHSVLILG